jgi:hypothetical protein
MGERNISIPQLDLFSPPAVQKSVEREYVVDYRPVTQIADKAPVIFEITEQKHFLDLHNSQLYVKLKLAKKDGTDIVAGKKVAPINNILHSLFEKVTVLIEGKEVTSSNKDYPYKAYLSNTLAYGKGAKETQLRAQGYYKDDADDMDKIQENQGGLRKKLLFEKSVSVELQSPLHEDIFMQQRFLPNNTKVVMKLDRTSDAFALMNLEAAGEYKIVIEDIVFKARMVELTPEAQYSISKTLETRPALYPYTKREIRVENLAKGFTSGVFDNIFPNKLPTRVFVGIVPAEAYNGNKKRNPFAFNNSGLTSISMAVDNNTIGTFTPDFTEEEYGPGVSSAYLGLFEAFRKLGSDWDIGFNVADFAKSYAIYAFNIKPPYDTATEPDQGHARLSVNLSKALEEASCLIIHSETPALMEITSTRNVILK